MALSTLFQPVTAQTKNAPIAGGLPNVDASNAPAGSNPSQDTAAQISIAPGSGPLSSMTQGAALTSPAGLMGLSGPGVFSGDTSARGVGNTLGTAGVNIATGMVPGGSAASAMMSGLGALAGLAHFFGYPGLTPTSELSGPIGEGLGMNSQFADPSAEGGYSGLSSSGGGFTGLGQGLANSINLGFSGPFGGRGINGQTGDPNNDSPITPTFELEEGGGQTTNGSPSGPAGPAGGPAGSGATSGATGASSASGADTSGDSEDTGGLIGKKRFPKAADNTHVMVPALNSEFVVNPQATRDHLGALKKINADQPRGGLRRLMGVK